MHQPQSQRPGDKRDAGKGHELSDLASRAPSGGLGRVIAGRRSQQNRITVVVRYGHFSSAELRRAAAAIGGRRSASDRRCVSRVGLGPA